MDMGLTIKQQAVLKDFDKLLVSDVKDAMETWDNGKIEDFV